MCSIVRAVHTRTVLRSTIFSGRRIVPAPIYTLSVATIMYIQTFGVFRVDPSMTLTVHILPSL